MNQLTSAEQAYNFYRRYGRAYRKLFNVAEWEKMPDIWERLDKLKAETTKAYREAINANKDEAQAEIKVWIDGNIIIIKSKRSKKNKPNQCSLMNKS